MTVYILTADIISHTTAPSRPGATAKRPDTRAATGGRRFFFRAETKRLAEAQIQREARRARRLIDGDYRLAGCGNQIEAAIGSIFHSRSPWGATADCGARVVGGIAVYILSGGDVKGRAGTGNHERAYS